MEDRIDLVGKLAIREILSRLYLLFQILQLKARMAEKEVTRRKEQICVLGNTLAEDVDFLDICRGFEVKNP